MNRFSDTVFYTTTLVCGPTDGRGRVGVGPTIREKVEGRLSESETKTSSVLGKSCGTETLHSFIVAPEVTPHESKKVRTWDVRPLDWTPSNVLNPLNTEDPF